MSYSKQCFYLCMFPERGPSEPQDGDGNGMQLRFDRRAPKTCQKRLKESKLLKEYGENSQEQSNQTSASIFRITKIQGKHGTTYFFCNMFPLSSWENMGSLGSGSEGCSCWQLRRSPWASRHSMSGPTRPTLFVFFSYEKSVRTVRSLKRSQKPEKSEEWSPVESVESWWVLGSFRPKFTQFILLHHGKASHTFVSTCFFWALRSTQIQVLLGQYGKGAWEFCFPGSGLLRQTLHLHK